MWHPQYQFPELLKFAPIGERLKYFEKGFVLKHAMIESVKEELKTSFFYSTEQSIALITGPTGVGKSCLATSIYKDYYNTFNESDGEADKSIPMVYFEMDVHSTGAFNWKNFYTRLLKTIGEVEDMRFYGKPTSVGDYGGRKYSTRSRSEPNLKEDVEIRLRDGKVLYILLDEIHLLFKYGNADRNLNILKNLANKTDCRFIGLGTYQIHFAIDQSAEIARRCVSINFPGYSIGTENEGDLFVSAYMGLLAYMPIQINRNVAEFATEAYVGCCGCIGILKEWLSRALRLALNEGADLEIKHLKKTRLKTSQLIPIAEEIKEGKNYFIEPDNKHIAELLGLGGQNRPKSKSSNLVAGNTKPGVRTPSRDEVN